MEERGMINLSEKLTVMIHFDSEHKARKFFQIFDGEWTPETYKLVHEIFERTETSCIDSSEEVDGYFEIELGG